MNITVAIILGFIILAGANVAVLIFLNRRKPQEPLKQDDTGLKLLLEQVNEQNRRMDLNLREMTKTVDSKIGENTRTMGDSLRNQFGESQKLIDKFLKEVTNMAEKVTRVEETGKQMVGFADQLQSLQDILKNPKQRGILGEYYLETLLKNVLAPDQYQMQYAFKNGEIVDAVVKIKDKIIPIDSKFSLENYNRLIEVKDPSEKERLEKLFVNDLKTRIAETSKYIRPAEGTMDFAFMFIPHEAIYYDLLINKIGALAEDTENLIQRAAGKYKVIIVSPTSFLAYLQTVLQGLKAMQIEETAKDIIKRVGELGEHLKKYEMYHVKLGNSLETVVNHFNASNKEFKKVDKDVTRITGTAVGVGVIALEKPDQEE